MDDISNLITRPSFISITSDTNFLQVPSPKYDSSSYNDDQSIPKLSPADYKPFEKWRLSPVDSTHNDVKPFGGALKKKPFIWKGGSVIPGLYAGVTDGDDDDDDNDDNDSQRCVPVTNQIFNMRLATLDNLPLSQTVNRSNYRAQSVSCTRAKQGETRFTQVRPCLTSSQSLTSSLDEEIAGSVQNTAKSLDLMRQIVQASINKEIQAVITKYIQIYFEPAMANIRLNNGPQAVTTEDVQNVCCQILEECKSMFTMSGIGSATTPDMSEVGGQWGVLEHRAVRAVREGRKRRISSGSESSANTVKNSKRVRRPAPQPSSNRSTPSRTIKPSETRKRSGPQWDPERLKSDTMFIMGAKANKALGLGATRGRIYVKHPELFKYAGDQDDKQWLHENRLMPATGGRSYLLIVDDIQDLADNHEDYKNSSALLLHELKGFTVPVWMLEKMKVQMGAQRTDQIKSSLLQISDLTSPLAQASPTTSMDNDEEQDDDAADDDNQRGNSPLNSTGGFLMQGDFPHTTNQHSLLSGSINEMETGMDEELGLAGAVDSELLQISVQDAEYELGSTSELGHGLDAVELGHDLAEEFDEANGIAGVLGKNMRLENGHNI